MAKLTTKQFEIIKQLINHLKESLEWLEEWINQDENFLLSSNSNFEYTQRVAELAAIEASKIAKILEEAKRIG